MASAFAWGVLAASSLVLGAWIAFASRPGCARSVADTMMPEAYKHGGKLVGVVTTLVLALLVDQLD